MYHTAPQAQQRYERRRQALLALARTERRRLVAQTTPRRVSPVSSTAVSSSPNVAIAAVPLPRCVHRQTRVDNQNSCSDSLRCKGETLKLLS